MIDRRNLGRGFAGALLLGAALLALPGCDGITNPGAEVRYRLKVEVETPEGVKSGSSVLSVHARRTGDWSRQMTSRTGGYGSRGEAVAVDLPGGRTLFALLRGEDQQISPFHWLAFANGLDLADFEDPQTLLEAVSGREERVLPRRYETGCVPSQNCDDDAYPMLVTFNDIKDPTSVQQVDPDKLEASFGPGYKLKGITLQVTDEPVTVGIEKRLGWLPNYYDKMLDGDTINRSQALANNLSQNSFQQGQSK
jgi:hypothetical protein